MDLEVPETKEKDQYVMLLLPKFTVHRVYFYPKNSTFLLLIIPINNVKDIMSIDCGTGARKLPAVTILKPMETRSCNIWLAEATHV